MNSAAARHLRLVAMSFPREAMTMLLLLEHDLSVRVQKIGLNLAREPQDVVRVSQDAVRVMMQHSAMERIYVAKMRQNAAREPQHAARVLQHAAREPQHVAMVL